MMKKLIYAAVAATMMFGGCEYHPYYDGQEFCIYDDGCGLIKEDGAHIVVPVKDKHPYVLEFYGGSGKNHKIMVEDPEILGYVYEEPLVSSTLIDGMKVVPANIVLQPKRTGGTSVTVEDVDAGKSIQVYVTVLDSYKAIEVSEGNAAFETGTIFALPYDGTEDVVKICRGSLAERDVEHIVDGRFAFVIEDDLLYFELTYPADESGRPSAEGVETGRRYQIRHYQGMPDDGTYMMLLLNLKDYPYVTKGYYEPDHYDVDLRFADVTGLDEPMTEEEAEYDYFVASSARLLPWTF